jgi:hypothetical protein
VENSDETGARWETIGKRNGEVMGKMVEDLTRWANN